MNQRHHNGFSLIELMMSAFILIVLLGAVFSQFYKAQKTFPSEHDFAEATQNARYALDFMASIIRQAGNDMLRTANNPCGDATKDHPSIKDCTSGTPTGSPIEPIQPTGTSQLRMLTDITGSIVGTNQGDPNGNTCNSYEDVTFQYNAGTQEIQMALGNATPVSIAKNITSLTFSYYKYDLATQALVATAVPCEIQVVRMTAGISAANPDMQATNYTTPGYTLYSDAQIRSRD